MEGNKKQGTPALRVLELFAGVGGFRFGLNEVKNDAGNAFEVVWANQFEPSSKKQWAADVYKARWGSADLVNEDIFKVLDDEAAMARIDALCPDMLVGGFPCQDYSVAQPLSRSQGLAGKKGVLWWSIHRLLEARIDAGSPVKYVMLENVDRLLSTPTNCRGRDFAVILAALQSLGYAVEWRVVNAADYGHAQKRRRVFIMAYHQSTALYAKLAAKVQQDASDWMLSCGVLASALPAQLKDGSDVRSFAVQADVYAAQETYTPVKGRSQFAAGGVCLAGQVWTGDMQAQAFSDYTQFTGQRQAMTLGDVVGQTTQEVAQRFFLTTEALPRWQALKGAKSSPRVNASGHAYEYKEGAVAFPDPLQRPARTIITSEGGTCASRTSHVVAHADGRLRRLVPEELEALNGFDRGFTDIPNIPAAKRAFLMGNALVTGLVTRLGEVLSAEHAADTPPPAPAQEAAPATQQPAESSMVTVSGVQTLSQAGGQPLVQQRLLLGEVDLHRGVGTIGRDSPMDQTAKDAFIASPASLSSGLSWLIPSSGIGPACKPACKAGLQKLIHWISIAHERNAPWHCRTALVPPVGRKAPVAAGAPGTHSVLGRASQGWRSPGGHRRSAQITLAPWWAG